LESSAERVSQYETREQSREDKGEDGERKNATASFECKREEERAKLHYAESTCLFMRCCGEIKGQVFNCRLFIAS